MGNSTSISVGRGKNEPEPIRLIDFEDFKELGEYPRFPDHKKIAQDVKSLDLSEIFVVYISHVWLRSRPSMEGYEEYPRPDSASNDQYKLCVAGVQSLLKMNQVKLKKCYLWLDYSCINQTNINLLNKNAKCDGLLDHGNEIDIRMGDIMYICDCMLTPDSGLSDVAHKNDFRNEEVVASTGHDSYLNRGWCRVEMFYAAFIPLSAISQQKLAFVRGAVAHAFEINRRPHFVYGMQQFNNNKVPLVVPAMKHMSIRTYNPVNGYFTIDNDKKIVRRLFNALAYHHMKPLKLGYQGVTDEGGLRHGNGRYVFSSGAVYEGGYHNGLKNGFGRFELASGDVYEGGYKNDRREGHGVFKYANGDWYEGTWCDGKPNGQGKVEYASGDAYEGHFKHYMKHGFGIFTFASGCQYEGWYKDDLRHGQGKYSWSDGDAYDGEWKNHMKHGYGEFRFKSGGYYKGMWREDNRHGKGVYRLMNGEVYEGEYKNDMREGNGTYQFRSGAKYEGPWRKHLKNGLGKLYYRGEVVFDGEWIDDKPQGYVDPMLIFEDDIQYVEVLAVVRHAKEGRPALKEEPIVRVLDRIEPTGHKVKSQMSDEYFNEDGILDEDDDFHPKNLFRRKSEDWIDRAPKWTQRDEETILARAKADEKDDSADNILEDFHVEKEIGMINYSPVSMMDDDKHYTTKKMFFPVRKILNIKKINPTNDAGAIDTSREETKEECFPAELDETHV